MPAWYLDEPSQHPLNAFYMKCFWDLNSERKFEHGPIPWSKIVSHGYHNGLEQGIIDAFVAIIRAMDAGYLKWSAEQAKRKQSQG